MNIDSFVMVIYGAIILFPVLGSLLAYGLARRYPQRHFHLMVLWMVMLAMAAASSSLSVVYPGPLVRAPWSLPWVVGALSFFCISVPFWVSAIVFHIQPPAWRHLRWVGSLVVGYASMFPTMFLVLFASCGYVGACL